MRAIAPSLDDKTRNALVYVDLKPHEGVKAGMFARGEFELGQQHALTVPQVAIVPRDGFNHVLLVQPDSRVRLHKVQLGRRDGERVELLQALPPGAQVVLQGAGFLNDGDLVRVVAAPAVAPASAASGGAPAASASEAAVAASSPASSASK